MHDVLRDTLFRCNNEVTATFFYLLKIATSNAVNKKYRIYRGPLGLKLKSMRGPHFEEKRARGPQLKYLSV